MRNEIVVIGGYGNVGAQICRALGAKWPGLVYAAGRNAIVAAKFTSTTYGQVKPLQLSVQDGVTALPENTKLVIMCIDQHDPAFAVNCLRKEIDYIDISANLDLFNKMENMKQQENWSATALLSVGLAPGLSSLFAKAASQLLDRTDRVNIAIMLGLGDEHGNAAIEWTIDSLHQTYSVMEQGQLQRVHSFTEPKLVDYGFELGKRSAYRFPFSDQQTVARTLQIPSVSTYLSFDSRFFTAAGGLLQRFKLFQLLRRPLLRKLAVKMFGKLKWGSDVCALSVCAEGMKDGFPYQASIGLKAQREGVLTARVAIAMAESLYTGKFPNGIYHSEQLFEVEIDKVGQLLMSVNHKHPLNEDLAGMKEIIISDVRCWVKESLIL